MNDQNQQTHAETKLALLSAWVEYRDRVNELERENAALRADKERLDWLETNSRESIYGPSWRIAWEFGQDVSLRAAIDAARNGGQP